MIFFRCNINCFCEDLKEGFIFDGADGEVSLWAVESETGALSAGDDKGGDLSLGDELVAEMFCLVIFSALGIVLRLKGIKWRRREVGRQKDGCGIQDEITAPVVNQGEIEPAKLCEEFILPGGVEAVPEGEEVCLAIFFQDFFQFFYLRLVCHKPFFTLKRHL